MSRWVTNKVHGKFGVTAIEAGKALLPNYAYSSSSCNNWKSSNALQHILLRDTGASNSVQTALGLSKYGCVVLDANLKIVAKENCALASGQANILSALGAL
ncbi:MAG: hypothetical protein H6707_14900 [Deltaproteobacteria bacterium]|nr:hypothetical protein [Deltaproteobacteria bacterium]